jgi:hypothetical protein
MHLMDQFVNRIDRWLDENGSEEEEEDDLMRRE